MKPSHIWEEVREFLVGFGIVCAIAGMMYGLARLHMIFPIELWGQGPFFSAGPAGALYTNTQGEAKEDSRVAVVEITDRDYQELFRDESPLCRDVLKRLIEKVGVAEHIVLDIDLSGRSRRCDSNQQGDDDPLQKAAVDPSKFTVVEPTVQIGGIPALLSRDHPPQIRERAVSTGVSLFPYDWAFRARSYLKKAKVRMGVDPPYSNFCKMVPTLAMAATTPDEGGEAPEVCAEMRERSEPYFLNFSRARVATYEAGDILQLDDKAVAAKLAGKEFVVVGGSFGAARDLYPTPAGPMYGVQLVALSIDAELNHSGIGETTLAQAFGADLLLGIVLVTLGFLFEKHAIIVTCTAGILLSVLSSVLVFQTQKLFLNFVPLVLGALAHVCADKVLKIRKQRNSLEKEHICLRAEIALLEKENCGLQIRIEELSRPLEVGVVVLKESVERE